jgi:hypothetical protein
MKTRNVMPADLKVGDKVQFCGEVGTVISNQPAFAPVNAKHDLFSRDVGFAFVWKSDTVTRLKGTDAMKVIEE